MSESPQEEPKFIVDEDWKEQVEKEKEALRAAQAASTDEASTDEASTAVNSDSEKEPAAGAGSEQAPPPASFVTLISMLFTQAMAMLGQIPDPSTGKPTVDKPIAKHYIDTLELLEGKTKGNLDEEEAKMLSEAMHALRMAYVSVKAK